MATLFILRRSVEGVLLRINNTDHVEKVVILIRKHVLQPKRLYKIIIRYYKQIIKMLCKKKTMF